MLVKKLSGASVHPSPAAKPLHAGHSNSNMTPLELESPSKAMEPLRPEGSWNAVLDPNRGPPPDGFEGRLLAGHRNRHEMPQDAAWYMIDPKVWFNCLACAAWGLVAC